MSTYERRYSKEEMARRGEEIYTRIKPAIENGNEGKFVAIDIETGDYEMDADEMAASDRLRVRHPDAQTWLVLIGSRTARHIRTLLAENKR